jgi:hypothetical protein
MLPVQVFHIFLKPTAIAHNPLYQNAPRRHVGRAFLTETDSKSLIAHMNPTKLPRPTFTTRQHVISACHRESQPCGTHLHEG